MGQTEIEQGFQGLVQLFILIIVLAAIYSFFFVQIRKVMLRKIKALMQKNANQNNIEFDDNQEFKELPATSKLEFLKLNVDSDVLELSLKRKKVISKIKKRYYQRLVLDFIFSILYFLVIYWLAHIFYNASQILVTDVNTIRADVLNGVSDISELVFANELVYEAGRIMVLLNFFLYAIEISVVWLFLKFLGSYYRFTAYKNRISNVLKPIWNFVSYLFVSKFGYPLYFILFVLGLAIIIKIVSFSDYLPSTNIPIVLLIFITISGVHIIMHYIIMIRNRKQSNLQLLILRVFGKYSVSQNMFTKLAQFWKIFGSYFTVVDQSFYHVYWKKKYNTNLGLYVFFSIAMLFSIVFIGSTIQEDFKSLFGAIVTFLALFSLIYPLIYVYNNNLKKIRRDIIDTNANLDKRLQKLQSNPINFDFSFKEVPLLCYNNTWKMTVDRLSKFADIILMDLRGFSKTNKGCEYEVNFLFDYVSIDKIVFITDSESIIIIEQLLIEQWKMLLETSPNLKINEPKAVIYITVDEKDAKKETQGIIDALLYYAIKIDE